MVNAVRTQGTARDFDFWMGSWKVRNRRLHKRLAWSDAFSDDGGETWGTNWVMDFTPSAGRE